MKSVALCLLLISGCRMPLGCLGQTSNVETVKAWTRTHVMGVPGGTLLDPTGTIADAQRLAAIQASADAAGNLVSASSAGLSNALARLYAVTNRISSFSGRIYIAADMDSDPAYSNVWSAVIHESLDPDGTLHYYKYYSRELASPPRTRWGFAVSPDLTLWADGTAPTNNVTTNVLGYACYDIRVTRPAGVGNVVLRTERYGKFGSPGVPLDLKQGSVIRIIHGAVTNTAFSGTIVYTNVAGAVSNRITKTYETGLLFNIATNAIP